ncbi:probable dolichyl pyrophosphate Glc1Man9GlcNAc2 alpha-1,3-glucosyltransferase [Phalaenopsis equestris]|uniref:probable dolichyl pyrophosphate Glc1Man9GlcNAc2 alpha-1,3-glucosyltransferase n=1 Tax=Phalaenopsis equestris TaxID=78828 RepID=UPI0009E2FAF0|nr:probable dolichyl pyrophosphate Glc1Man9GlcNAc2 alpha-1,3-glucosyltransferase [Phalaenopsis equestris]
MDDLLWFFSLSTCIKALLIPSHRSTDFEPPRHWLALTSSLPLSRWYLDISSPWTLDYPPLFAYFSFLLSLPASLIDPTITDLIAGQNYAAPLAVVFLRLSVSAADLFLLAGADRLSRRLPYFRRRMVLVLVVWSPALLIVDHIHFQYNGFLLGILLISLGFLVEGRDLAGGIVFAILICSKHLFMVAAPLYFVYLLRHYCNGEWSRVVARFLMMGLAVGIVFLATFGPFVYYGQIQQVFHRLFPFGRGLCHAYWAPNFWVFYIMLDKVLAFILGKLGFSIQTPKASFTGGLVGDSSSFAVLPQVNPIATFLLVLLAMSPCLIKAFIRPQPKHIVRWVAYTFTCGFMFGWHVHEKASLHFTIPLGIIAVDSLADARHYFLLSIVSCYSMFPLLFEPQEYPIKVLLLVMSSVLMFVSFSSHFRKATKRPERKKVEGSGNGSGLVGPVAACYLLGFLCVEIWGQFLHPYIYGSRFPFLPLMLISVYCAVGMMYSWAWQLRQIIINT